MEFELDQEHRLVQDSVREFAEDKIRPMGKELDDEGRYPFDIVKEAAELGFVGVWIPEEYGGPGMGALADAIVKEETCRADPGIGFAMDSTLGGRMIRRFGSEAQKEAHLPGLASGEKISGIAISEPDAGSANRYMKTRAEPDGDGYVLNGEKLWITNAPVADFLVVMAWTDLESGPGDRHGMSAILVDTDIDGVEIEGLDLMGVGPSQTGQVVFDDARVDESAIVGEEGEGYQQLLAWFNDSRNFVSPMALGMAQGAYERALEYAQEREAFGQPVAEYQSIRHMLADMATEIEGVRGMCYRSAAKQDRGEESPKLASMAKLKASEVAEEVASDALQIHGAYGYSTEYDVNRFYRAAKVTQIVEGASEIQRNIIADQIL